MNRIVAHSLLLAGIAVITVTAPGRSSALEIGAGQAVPAAAAEMPPKQPPYAETVSEAARTQLAPFLNAPDMPEMTVAQMRTFADAVQKQVGAAQQARYPVTIKAGKFGGVPVRFIDSASPKRDRANRLLINFHGGGFTVDSGSLTENIPLAALSGTRIVSVLYRMAPEHPYPAAVDDAVAVYKAALKEHRPRDIGIYGTSAGAILTAQLLTRLRKEGLPMPGAAGAFSLTADFARAGDSEAFLPRIMGKPVNAVLGDYVGSTDRRDPGLSPLFGDLKGLPPTLVLTSTRDLLLSQSVAYHLALLRSGVDAELVVFEGLPHAFWSYIQAPESDEAFRLMDQFFGRHLGK